MTDLNLMVPWLCFIGVVLASVVIAVVTVIKSEVEG